MHKTWVCLLEMGEMHVKLLKVLNLEVRKMLREKLERNMLGRVNVDFCFK